MDDAWLKAVLQAFDNYIRALGRELVAIADRYNLDTRRLEYCFNHPRGIPWLAFSDELAMLFASGVPALPHLARAVVAFGLHNLRLRESFPEFIDSLSALEEADWVARFTAFHSGTMLAQEAFPELEEVRASEMTALVKGLDDFREAFCRGDLDVAVTILEECCRIEKLDSTSLIPIGLQLAIEQRFTQDQVIRDWLRIIGQQQGTGE